MSPVDRDDRLRALYDRYFRSVFFYLVRFGLPRERAREIAQEVFQRVSQHMDFQDGAAWSILQTTAHRLALNEIRTWKTKMRSGVEVSLDELPYLPDSVAKDLWTGQVPASQEEALVEQEEAARRKKWLYDAIADLPDGIRHCLLLWLGGLKYHEIQKTLNVTMDTVKSRLHEARIRLRARLAQEPEGPDWPPEDGHD